MPLIRRCTPNVEMNPGTINGTGDIKSNEPAKLSFADDFPYHLVCQSSLDDLNSRLDEKIGISRFRPNFVISGLPAYLEDQLNTFSIGTAKFVSISPCERCMVVNIDPRSAEKSRQPLKTLASFRRQGSKINFGQNVTATQEGVVAEGDRVLVGI